MSGKTKFVKKKRATDDGKDTSRHYVDKKEMYEAFVAYHERKKDNPEETVPEFIVSCFMKIADGVGQIHRFRNYQNLDDMKQDSVLLCIKYIDSYDISRKNPYSYFTSVITNGFYATINNDRRYLYKQYKAIENSMIFESLSDMQDIDGNIHEDAEIYSKHAQENMFNFISDYEDSIQKKKERALERQKENAGKD